MIVDLRRKKRKSEEKRFLKCAIKKEKIERWFLNFLDFLLWAGKKIGNGLFYLIFGIPCGIACLCEWWTYNEERLKEIRDRKRFLKKSKRWMKWIGGKEAIVEDVKEYEVLFEKLKDVVIDVGYREVNIEDLCWGKTLNTKKYTIENLSCEKNFIGDYFLNVDKFKIYLDNKENEAAIKKKRDKKNIFVKQVVNKERVKIIVVGNILEKYVYVFMEKNGFWDVMVINKFKKKSAVNMRINQLIDKSLLKETKININGMKCECGFC